MSSFINIPGGYVTPNGNVVMSNGEHGVITPNHNVVLLNGPPNPQTSFNRLIQAAQHHPPPPASSGTANSFIETLRQAKSNSKASSTPSDPFLAAVKRAALKRC